MSDIELTPFFSQLFMFLVGVLVALTFFSVTFVVHSVLKARQMFSGTTPTRPVPWGLPAVLLFVALCVVVTPTLLALIGEPGVAPDDEPEPGARLRAMACFSLGSLISMGLTIAVLRRSGTNWLDLGLSLGDLLTDIRLGVIAFGLVCLPMYGLQALLVKLWRTSEHPIVEIVGENPSPLFFAVLTITAVIVAPIVEELFFRVLMQGWFEKLALLFRLPPASRQAVLNEYWWGAPLHRRVLNSSGELPPASAPAAFERTLENPYVAPLTTNDPVSRDVTQKDRLPMWPVLASAALFAIAHAGYGPDPIPLFLLACVLGFLYRYTRRAWPCIVLHMLVNATSMSMLWIMVRGGQT